MAQYSTDDVRRTGVKSSDQRNIRCEPVDDSGYSNNHRALRGAR